VKEVVSKQIAVRFKPPLFEQLERRAEKDHRTIAGLIKHLCEIGLEGRRSSRRRDEQTEQAA
jgi:hypothetical protein